MSYSLILDWSVKMCDECPHDLIDHDELGCWFGSCLCGLPNGKLDIDRRGWEDDE